MNKPKTQRGKPVGAGCNLTMTWHNSVNDKYKEPLVGFFMQSEAGSSYLIVDVTPVEGHTNKYRLSCIKADPEKIPSDAVVLPFVWNKRK